MRISFSSGSSFGAGTCGIRSTGSPLSRKSESIAMRRGDRASRVLAGDRSDERAQPVQRQTSPSCEAEADRLVRDYGEQAYSVARLREDEASRVQMAQEWIRIARAVACRKQERVGLSTGRDCLMLNRSAALILSRSVPLPVPSLMSRVRSAAQAIKTSKPGERKDAASLLPRWIPPQLVSPPRSPPPGTAIAA
jgi:hypothetical protein